jgi:hypothetical protein
MLVTDVREALEVELTSLASKFGRLVFVAAMRNPLTGVYEWEPRHGHIDSQAGDRVLRELHQDCFRQWNGLNLAERRADLTEHLTPQGTDAFVLLRSMCRSGLLDCLAPERVSEDERRRFSEQVAELLAN